jgi:serine/threonine protein kinase
MALAPGFRLGPYEILSPLGAGGMGEVYRAQDSRLEREVALEVLPESVAGDPHALARFEREAKAVAALSHQNILASKDGAASHVSRSSSPRNRPWPGASSRDCAFEAKRPGGAGRNRGRGGGP